MSRRSPRSYISRTFPDARRGRSASAVVTVRRLATGYVDNPAGERIAVRARVFHTIAAHRHPGGLALPPRIALAALAVLLALPAAAPAATTLGQTGTGGDPCDANATLAQIAGSAPEYEVRGPGVITELRTEGVTGSGNELHVFRPRGNQAFTVLASAPVAENAGLVRVPVRVPVQAGDVLGMSTAALPDPHPNCTISGIGGADNVIAFRTTGPAPESGDVTLDDADAGRLNVAATLEPDGDGDGFGDETQDRCPSDGARTDDCSADILLTQTPVENEMERDDVNVLVIVARNNGSSPARDVRIVESFPAGLQLVAATPTSGGCAGGPTLDCTLPSVAAGSAGSIFVVVKAVSVGRKEMSATASSPTPDPISSNNTVETAFEVNARRSVVEPGAFCRVPRLFGLTRSAARKSLEAAGCRLGRVNRRRFRSGRFARVRLQSIPAFTRVATRTRVHITLRRR